MKHTHFSDQGFSEHRLLKFAGEAQKQNPDAPIEQGANGNPKEKAEKLKSSQKNLENKAFQLTTKLDKFQDLQGNSANVSNKVNDLRIKVNERIEEILKKAEIEDQTLRLELNQRLDAAVGVIRLAEQQLALRNGVTMSVNDMEVGVYNSFPNKVQPLFVAKGTPIAAKVPPFAEFMTLSGTDFQAQIRGDFYMYRDRSKPGYDVIYLSSAKPGAVFATKGMSQMPSGFEAPPTIDNADINAIREAAYDAAVSPSVTPVAPGKGPENGGKKEVTRESRFGPVVEIMKDLTKAEDAGDKAAFEESVGKLNVAVQWFIDNEPKSVQDLLDNNIGRIEKSKEQNVYVLKEMQEGKMQSIKVQLVFNGKAVKIKQLDNKAETEKPQEKKEIATALRQADAFVAAFNKYGMGSPEADEAQDLLGQALKTLSAKDLSDCIEQIRQKVTEMKDAKTGKTNTLKITVDGGSVKVGYTDKPRERTKEQLDADQLVKEYKQIADIVDEHYRDGKKGKGGTFKIEQFALGAKKIEKVELVMNLRFQRNPDNFAFSDEQKQYFKDREVEIRKMAKEMNDYLKQSIEEDNRKELEKMEKELPGEILAKAAKIFDMLNASKPLSEIREVTPKLMEDFEALKKFPKPFDDVYAELLTKYFTKGEGYENGKIYENPAKDYEILVYLTKGGIKTDDLNESNKGHTEKCKAASAKVLDLVNELAPLILVQEQVDIVNKELKGMSDSGRRRMIVALKKQYFASGKTYDMPDYHVKFTVTDKELQMQNISAEKKKESNDKDTKNKLTVMRDAAELAVREGNDDASLDELMKIRDVLDALSVDDKSKYLSIFLDNPDVYDTENNPVQRWEMKGDKLFLKVIKRIEFANKTITEGETTVVTMEPANKIMTVFVGNERTNVLPNGRTDTKEFTIERSGTQVSFTPKVAMSYTFEIDGLEKSITAESPKVTIDKQPRGPKYDETEREEERKAQETVSLPQDKPTPTVVKKQPRAPKDLKKERDEVVSLPSDVKKEESKVSEVKRQPRAPKDIKEEQKKDFEIPINTKPEGLKANFNFGKKAPALNETATFNIRPENQPLTIKIGASECTVGPLDDGKTADFVVERAAGSIKFTPKKAGTYAFTISGETKELIVKEKPKKKIK